MKLYAITTSERASKGQGGNKKLDTWFKWGDDREIVLFVQMDVHNDALWIKVHDKKGNMVYQNSKELSKGKQKKDEEDHEDIDDSVMWDK